MANKDPWEPENKLVYNSAIRLFFIFLLKMIIESFELFFSNDISKQGNA